MANDYFADEGLTQIREEVVGDEKITAEKLTIWSSELRMYNESIERRLDRHSLLDPPEDRGHAELEPGAELRSDDYIITIDDAGDESDEWVIEYREPRRLRRRLSGN